MNDQSRDLYESIAVIGQLEQLCSSLDIDQLAERLVRGGVLSRDEFDSVVQELASPGEPTDTTLVADALVRTHRVSLYQLWTAASGQPERLSLGEYTVVEPLGAGGMGEVLLAVHRRMKRQVAIKFLPVHFADNEEMVRRFEREVEVAAQLSHPNIVTAHDAGRTGDTHFLVMEYVDGCDLGTLVHKSGALPLDDAIKCVLQAGRGIAHAHHKEVIHRDIKPSNLLADRLGAIKVLDMGLARWSSASAQSAASDLSVTGAVMGTVDFMAPEQAVSAKTADHRADIYSLGCTLYMLAKGHPIFAGDTVIEKIMAHQTAEIPDLVDGDDDRSKQLNQVFHRMLAKRPDDRFDTMDAACQALAACLADGGGNLSVALSIPDKSPVRSYALLDTKNKLPENSLISTVDLSKEAKQATTPTVQGNWGRGAIIAVVAVLLLGGGAYFGGPFLIKLVTPEGTLLVKCFVEGAIVEVDGKEMVRVTDPESQAEYRFDLPKGEHRVRAVLPDGTEIKSGTIEIRGKDDTLFEVLREAAPRGPPGVADQQPPAPAVDDDPNVLTVAQDGSAEYTSIGAAVAAVKPGQTIRIIDDGDYRECVSIISSQNHANLTIESTGNAILSPGLAVPRAMIVDNVPGVTLRSLRFETHQPTQFGLVFNGSVAGGQIENCQFTATDLSMPLFSLEGVKIEEGEPPVIVADCSFRGVHTAMQISGAFDESTPMTCSNILIRNNFFDNCGFSLALRGHVRDAWIVANTFSNGGQTAVQTHHVLPVIHNVVVSNNSFFHVPAAFRIWEDGVKEADVSVLANLTIGSEFQAVESGGDNVRGKGPGDGARYAQLWRFARNFREGSAPSLNSPNYRAWIPPSETSQLLDNIEVLSRDPASDDFLRPAPDSPLASGGMGGEFPTYAGAVPPEGTEPFDWERAFERSIVLSRVPEDVVTVAKNEIAHYTTINEALAAVKPGMTVRVIDDGVYEEVILLDDPTRHKDLILETMQGAGLYSGNRSVLSLIHIVNVPGVSVRGFRLDLGEQPPPQVMQSNPTGVTVMRNCPGVQLEGLTITAAPGRPVCNAFSLEFLDAAPGDPPVLIRDCEARNCLFGLRATGLHNDYRSTGVCRGLALVNCRFVDNAIGVVLLGDIRDVLISGNLVDRAALAGMQLEQLAESCSNIVFANNTLSRCRFGFRVFTGDFIGDNVQIVNNLSFQCELDWSSFKNAGDQFSPAGPGDISRLLSEWTATSNYREGSPLPPTTSFAEAWIPGDDPFLLTEKIDLVSRTLTDPDFARPAPDSPLATQGAGGLFPTYVGAVPPDPEQKFDWTPLINAAVAKEPVDNANENREGSDQ